VALRLFDIVKAFAGPNYYGPDVAFARAFNNCLQIYFLKLQKLNWFYTLPYRSVRALVVLPCNVAPWRFLPLGRAVTNTIRWAGANRNHLQ